MEKSSREPMLRAGLDLLGRVGLKNWSMRAVEDEAGVPHGTARHHFSNQRGLVLAMVRHLLDVDRPSDGATVHDQVVRWVGIESGWTRARYELIVASFHDVELAAEIVRARDRLIEDLVDRGLNPTDATALAVSLDGFVLDAVLRRSPAARVDLDAILSRFGVD